MSKDKEKVALQERVLFVGRCSKVVKGGRRFSFFAVVVAGNGDGRVGFAMSKANELSDCIRRGGELAKRNLIEFEREGGTVPHAVRVRWDGTVVMIKPAKPGTGLIAGSCVRNILELAGIRDAVAKLYGSNNKSNQVHATFRALRRFRNRVESIRLRRNKGAA
ncbi:30S ribosomal protein S5 [Candidatus Similichlamydia epinepheli]|uniref:30S ribosomal protein S5 n=1 Tax=Candidatus Similichlamydia epinepheli TaxID=1903953 RepID=UPI000D3C96CC|nr:30S ribosomal protein S5 [Candidatus Similichlamydia epinepheli]